MACFGNPCCQAVRSCLRECCSRRSAKSHLQVDYSATKAYVIALGEALQVELAADGIDVSIVAPGPTATEFFSNASMTASAASSPTQVARSTVRNLRQRRVLIPDWLGWGIRTSLRSAPRWLAVRIVGRVMAGMSGVRA